MCKILSQEHIQSDDEVPMSQLYTMSSKMKSAFYVIRREDLQADVEMYPKEVPPLHVMPHIVFTAVLVPQIHTLCRRVYDLEKDTLNHLGFERLVMICTGLENIRVSIPFLRYPGHYNF